MNEYLISSLNQQWRKDPTSRVFFRLAEEYRKGGAYRKAIEVLREGIGHHPNYLPAQVSLGRCHREIGETREAEEAFASVLAKAPDNPHALRGLGMICHEQGRFEEALRYLEMLVLEEPTDEEALSRIDQIRKDWAPPGEVPTASSDHLEEDDDATEPITLDFGDFDSEPESQLEESSEVHSDAWFGEAGSETFGVGEPLPEELTSDDFFDESGSPDTGDEEITEKQDPIEVEFALAMSEDSAPDLLDSEALLASVAEDQEPETLTHSDEERLTRGLKHEKMAHYEAAQHIYRSLQQKYPRDRIVSGHLDRVNVLMAREGITPKKIRILSNWLDKIKGAYHVR